MGHHILYCHNFFLFVFVENAGRLVQEVFSSIYDHHLHVFHGNHTMRDHCCIFWTQTLSLVTHQPHETHIRTLCRMLGINHYCIIVLLNYISDSAGGGDFMIMWISGYSLYWASVLPNVVDYREERCSFCYCIHPLAACHYCYSQLGSTSGEITCWNVRSNFTHL